MWVVFAIDGGKLPYNTSKESRSTRAYFERKASKMDPPVARLLKAHAKQDVSGTLDPNEANRGRQQAKPGEGRALIGRLGPSAKCLYM